MAEATITFSDGRAVQAVAESISVSGVPDPDTESGLSYKLVYRTLGYSLWYVPLDSVLSIVFKMERPKRSRRLRRKFSQVTPTPVPVPVDKAVA